MRSAWLKGYLIPLAIILFVFIIPPAVIVKKYKPCIASNGTGTSTEWWMYVTIACASLIFGIWLILYPVVTVVMKKPIRIINRWFLSAYIGGITYLIVMSIGTLTVTYSNCEESYAQGNYIIAEVILMAIFMCTGFVAMTVEPEENVGDEEEGITRPLVSGV